MCALAFVRWKAQASIKRRVTGRRAFEQAQVAGAAAGLFGGVAAGVFGAVFTAASWLVVDEGARRWLSTTGMVLLFLAIPLLIIGGCCLDWLEKGLPQRHSKVVRYEDEDDD
jgi:anti-sigma factor RsiW